MILLTEAADIMRRTVSQEVRVCFGGRPFSFIHFSMKPMVTGSLGYPLPTGQPNSSPISLIMRSLVTFATTDAADTTGYVSSALCLATTSTPGTLAERALPKADSWHRCPPPMR